MTYKPFAEKQIREKIIGKIKPDIRKGRSTHDKGKVFLDSKKVVVVKIPNTHSVKMSRWNIKRLASSLHLSNEELNQLVECPISGADYYRLLRERANR